MCFFRLTSYESTGIRQFQNLKIFSTIEFIEMETMVKYGKEFKKQALLLPDEREVKKAAEQLGINYYTIADWRKVRSQKAKEESIASDKTPLNERELAMQQEIQELKKARFNCGNQIVWPQLNVKFPMRKLTELSFCHFHRFEVEITGKILKKRRLLSRNIIEIAMANCLIL